MTRPKQVITEEGLQPADRTIKRTKTISLPKGEVDIVIDCVIGSPYTSLSRKLTDPNNVRVKILIERRVWK